MYRFFCGSVYVIQSKEVPSNYKFIYMYKADLMFQPPKISFFIPFNWRCME